MFWSLVRALGRVALFLVAALFLALVSIFVVAVFLLTWPLHHSSPRERRLKATTDFAASLMTLLGAFSEGSVRSALAAQMATTEEPSVEDVSYPYWDGNVLILGPECFVAQDGSVLTWRGQDFAPFNLGNVVEFIEEWRESGDTP